MNLTIRARVSCHFELSPFTPSHLLRLKKLLSQNFYEGPDDSEYPSASQDAEANDDSDNISDSSRKNQGENKKPRSEKRKKAFYNLSDLNRLVQASEREIVAGLEKIGAIEIDGYWRLIHPKYLEEILNLVSLLCIAKRWPVSAVPLAQVLEEISPQYDPSVVRHFFKTFSESEDNQDKGNFSSPPPQNIFQILITDGNRKGTMET